MKHRLLIPFLAAALMSCFGPSQSSRLVMAEQSAVRDATTPPQVTLSDVRGPIREGSSVRASWTVPAIQPWEQYTSWARPRLQARAYALIRSDGEICVFAKHLPGDAFAVTMTHLSDGRIAVAFTSMPD